MKSLASISIVVPTYRRADMLTELSHALVPQLRDGVEVLIVDNCPDGSARETVAGFVADHAHFYYLHEPQSGVVHARNAGVAGARGEYILFLDDDEVPSKNWVAAFSNLAKQDVMAAFGRIVPRYEDEPSIELHTMLNRCFSREFDHPSGHDLTPSFVDLGTGNAMFHKKRCFGNDVPFDARFNHSGGEDTHLIKTLVNRGAVLSWCPAGLVEELVPAARMRAQYLRERRYAQGQLRCQILARSPRISDRIKVPIWMGVGAMQMVIYGAKMAFGKDVVANKIRYQGGLGKLMWWHSKGVGEYANAG